MIIKNVKVYQEDQTFKEGEICIRDGVFVGNADAQEGEEILDGEGCYAIPGMIDLHFHGCMGYDFCDGTKEAIREIARYEASIGVTAIGTGNDDASGAGTGAHPFGGSCIPEKDRSRKSGCIR